VEELPESEKDAALVVRARAGDASAFEQLVRRHLRVAHAVAFRHLDNSADAEDVVQDAFVRALERLEDCRQPERFRSWLLTIVRNRAHNVRAREAVRATEPMESAPRASGGPDPSVETEERELRERLDGALATLTEVQRNVFVLYAMEGYDHAEVAERLGVSTASSRFNLHVARRALKERLSTSLPPGWSR
jgi:RNA polymerase sigma-70 factor (ECF subfamily)